MRKSKAERDAFNALTKQEQKDARKTERRAILEAKVAAHPNPNTVKLLTTAKERADLANT